MYLHRLLETTLERAARAFPALVICGPRQSGKSTLLAHCVPAAPASVISLDDPDRRRLILDDPAYFLDNVAKPVVLDEIQYAPEILSYVKLRIDRDRTPGQWYITGSQQFSVMKNVAESLAGRAAVFSLPPFSLRERKTVGGISDFLLSGSYPELVVNPAIPAELWYSSYLQTYIERDVRLLLNVANLRDFEQCIRLLAANTGQVLNLSGLARKIGVSVPTIKRWISVLEASYIIFLLPPFFENFGKRITKAPKVYFYDVGLVNYLVGIRELDFLLQGPMAGAIFETAVVAEIMKNRLATGVKPGLYYFRTQSGLEIDLIEQGEKGLIPYEIKLAATIKPAFYKNLRRWLAMSGRKDGKGFLISNCKQHLPLPGDIENIYWRDIQ